MNYEGTIYRPPSEAGSLLIQATIGCAWNKCTFCDMYKDKAFRVRSLADIVRDLRESAVYRDRIRRIFLCDGNALAISTQDLAELLETIRTLYPDLEGVRAYASARDILGKTPRELKLLASLGLDMLFIGLESGSDSVLRKVNKGITKQQMIDAAHLLHEAGIRQSVSIIAGLGGEEAWQEHIRETADALNSMQPDFLGMLVLYVGSDAELYQEIRRGSFRLPSASQVMDEMRLLLQSLILDNCYFTSAHISNYLHVKGRLPQDKEQLLAQIGGVRFS